MFSVLHGGGNDFVGRFLYCGQHFREGILQDMGDRRVTMDFLEIQEDIISRTGAEKQRQAEREEIAKKFRHHDSWMCFFNPEDGKLDILTDGGL